MRPCSGRHILAVAAALAFVSGCALPASTPATPPALPPMAGTKPGETPTRPSEVLEAQRAARPPEPARMEITEASIRGHMEFLASDALNGRASGSRDEWIAATYVASQFRQWGLEPLGDAGGFVQRVDMASFEAVAPPVLAAGALKITHGEGMLVQGLGGPRTVTGLLHQFVRGTAVPSGAVVLLPAGATPQDRAAAAEAALVLSPETPQVRSGWEAAARRLPATALRAIRLPVPERPRPTRIVLAQSSYDALWALANGTAVTLAVDTKQASASAATWNAVARLTGSDPSLTRDVLVLSAHLDHIGARAVPAGQDPINNGADDDASGTVAVLELAKALARGPRPARTIVFALFGSEENGGFGAGFFVDLPVVPLDRIVADLQFEMIGRPDPMVPAQTLWLTGYERSNLGAELARHGARLVPDPHPAESFFTRSDNIRFAVRGVVAHTVSSFGLHTDYHRPSDEIGTIDFAHMTEAIRSLLEPIRRLADSSFVPRWMPGMCPAPCR